MGRVPAPVRDRRRAQLLDAPVIIRILDHRLAGRGQATDVLREVPKGATYGKTLEALEDRFGDQHLASAYWRQLKARTQGVGESLEESATTVEELAHRAYPALPRGPYKEAGKQSNRRRGRRPRHKNPSASVSRENGEWGSQAGTRAAGHAPRRQYILGVSIAPNRAKRPKAIGVLQLRSQATSGVTVPTGGRQKTMTGAGNKTKDLRDTREQAGRSEWRSRNNWEAGENLGINCQYHIRVHLGTGHPAHIRCICGPRALDAVLQWKRYRNGAPVFQPGSGQ
jgi:hypothetical protein